jgi:ankyrin repeat protein
VDCVALLLSRKASVAANKYREMQFDDEDHSVLHTAVRLRSATQTLEALVAAGARVNYRAGQWGIINPAPLHLAIKTRAPPRICLFLLKAKARVNLCDWKRRTPLHLAARHLAAQHLAAQHLDARHLVARHLVAQHKDTAAYAKLLLAAKANVGLANDFRRTPLHVAARRGSAACVELLIAAKANVEAPLAYRRPDGLNAQNAAEFERPLHMAVQRMTRMCLAASVADTLADRYELDKHTLGVIKALLDAKADVDGGVRPLFDSNLRAGTEGHNGVEVHEEREDRFVPQPHRQPDEQEQEPQPVEQPVEQPPQPVEQEQEPQPVEQGQEPQPVEQEQEPQPVEQEQEPLLVEQEQEPQLVEQEQDGGQEQGGGQGQIPMGVAFVGARAGAGADALNVGALNVGALNVGAGAGANRNGIAIPFADAIALGPWALRYDDDLLELFPQPAHAQPAHAQPANAQPAHAQPAHAQPANAQPANAQRLQRYSPLALAVEFNAEAVVELLLAHGAWPNAPAYQTHRCNRCLGYQLDDNADGIGGREAAEQRLAAANSRSRMLLLDVARSERVKMALLAAGAKSFTMM